MGEKDLGVQTKNLRELRDNLCEGLQEVKQAFTKS